MKEYILVRVIYRRRSNKIFGMIHRWKFVGYAWYNVETGHITGNKLPEKYVLKRAWMQHHRKPNSFLKLKRIHISLWKVTGRVIQPEENDDSQYYLQKC